MKELKFKIWDKKNKIMSNPFTIFSFKDTSENFNKFLSDDPETLLFTGLLDKTGKEIYEGDILSLNYFEGEVVKMWIEYLDTLPYCCTIIKYSEGDWVPLGRIMKRDGEQFTCEVIGNIYEHPELVK